MRIVKAGHFCMYNVESRPNIKFRRYEVAKMSSNLLPHTPPTVVLPPDTTRRSSATPKSLLKICVHYLEDFHLATSCPGAPRARHPHEGQHIFNWEHVTV